MLITSGVSARKMMIYLDNAASTRPSDTVVSKYVETTKLYGNPSSIHDYGRDAKKALWEAQDDIALKLKCNPEELYFTTGATMSNNVFIQGFLNANPNARLIISAVEHDDIIMLANYLDSKHGMKWVYRLPVDHEGMVNLTLLDELLAELADDDAPVLCVVQWANGECGTIQDMHAVASIVHAHANCYIYTDATQYVPYFKVSLAHVQVDGMGMSGQKIHGLKGTGLLYVRDGISLDPIIFGEQGLIGGTEDVASAAALAEAFNELTYDYKELINKRNYLLDGLKECGTLIGSITHRLPNNVYLCTDCDSETVVVLLNELGICASAGTACGSLNHQNGSHVVRALGYSLKESQSCVRFTLSDETTYEELDKVIQIVNEINIF